MHFLESGDFRRTVFEEFSEDRNVNLILAMINVIH